MSDNVEQRRARSKNLISNIALLGVGTILTKGISLIMVVLYSKWLTAGAYGDFELYVTYISLLLPVATLSCGEAVFRFLLERDTIKEQQKVITTALAIAFYGFIISVALLFLLARNLFTEYFGEFVVLFALETIFNMAQYCARGLHKLKFYTIASIINATVMAICTTVFVYFLKLNLKGLLFGHICGYLCATIFCTLTMGLHKYINYKEVSQDEAKAIAKYSAPLIPNSIAWWVANGSDRTIVRIYLGSEFNGIYSIANKVPALCITLFNVFHLSWQESASDALKEDENASKYFNEVFSRLLPTLFSVAIAVLSTNFFLFKYIFDSKYADGYVHVAILTSATMLSFMSQFIGGIFIGLKKTSVNGLTTVLAAGVNIVIDLLLIKYIGLFAASVSTLVAYLFLFVTRFIIVNRNYKLSINMKSWIYIAIFIYYVIAQYINNPILNLANLAVAVVLFLYTNRKYVAMVLSKIGLKGLACKNR